MEQQTLDKLKSAILAEWEGRRDEAWERVWQGAYSSAWEEAWRGVWLAVEAVEDGEAYNAAWDAAEDASNLAWDAAREAGHAMWKLVWAAENEAEWAAAWDRMNAAILDAIKVGRESLPPYAKEAVNA